MELIAFLATGTMALRYAVPMLWRHSYERDRLALAYEFAQDLTPAEPWDLDHPAAQAGHPTITALSLSVATAATPIAIGTALTSHGASPQLTSLTALAGVAAAILTAILWITATRHRRDLLAKERRELQTAADTTPGDKTPQHTQPKTDAPPCPATHESLRGEAPACQSSHP